MSEERATGRAKAAGPFRRGGGSEKDVDVDDVGRAILAALFEDLSDDPRVFDVEVEDDLNLDPDLPLLLLAALRAALPKARPGRRDLAGH
jgi:hypothetical protein